MNKMTAEINSIRGKLEDYIILNDITLQQAADLVGWKRAASVYKFLAGAELTAGLTLPEIVTPSTPASGKGKVYFKSDGRLYSLDDSGLEGKLVSLPEVLPVLADRRWAAMRVSGVGFLQSLFDGVDSGGGGGTGVTTFSGAVPFYARLTTSGAAGEYRQYNSQNSSLMLTLSQNFDLTFRV